MESFDIVIYHNPCHDGFTAAWIARRHSPNATFIGAQYKDHPPALAGKRVLICDFSYPRDQLLAMHEAAGFLLVLDHHKTAQADLADLEFCQFDMKRSGAGLVWDTLFPNEQRPPIVDMVEDCDLARFSIPGSRAFQAALGAVDANFENWDLIAAKSVAEVISSGEAILAFSRVIGRKFALRACRASLSIHDVVAVNCPIEFVVGTVDALLVDHPYSTILSFSWDGSRGHWYCSLRSGQDGPDVSEIAQEFGGGGHQHAAGFTSRYIPLQYAHKEVAILNPTSIYHKPEIIHYAQAFLRILDDDADALNRLIPIFVDGKCSSWGLPNGLGDQLNDLLIDLDRADSDDHLENKIVQFFVAFDELMTDPGAGLNLAAQLVFSTRSRQAFVPLKLAIQLALEAQEAKRVLDMDLRTKQIIDGILGHDADEKDVEIAQEIHITEEEAIAISRLIDGD